MAATLTQIREALATVASTVIPRASAEMLPKPEPPSCCVIPISVIFGATFDGGFTVTADIWCYVSPADLVKAQRSIDAYMAPDSLLAAFVADPSLGGVVDYC